MPFCILWETRRSPSACWWICRGPPTRHVNVIHAGIGGADRQAAGGRWRDVPLWISPRLVYVDAPLTMDRSQVEEGAGVFGRPVKGGRRLGCARKYSRVHAKECAFWAACDCSGERWRGKRVQDERRRGVAGTAPAGGACRLFNCEPERSQFRGLRRLEIRW